MFGKTPVTALEEYCAKKNVIKPVYDYINSEMDKSFVCRVSVFEQKADGIGRSKKEAKHDAAANIIKKLKISHPDIENIPQAPHETISTTDAIATLRDLCIQRDHPLPSFEIVQKSGPPEAPEFTAECCIATIKRYGIASTKKAAKQKAAQQIIDIIRTFDLNGNENQIMAIDDIFENEDDKNKKIIKTYRDYIESDIKIKTGTKLGDRHDYFKNLTTDEAIRSEAIHALNDGQLVSDCERVKEFLKILNIKYKESEMPCITTSKMIFIELLDDFDCCFADISDKIWTHMLEYFEDMVQ